MRTCVNFKSSRILAQGFPGVVKERTTCVALGHNMAHHASSVALHYHLLFPTLDSPPSRHPDHKLEVSTRV